MYLMFLSKGFALLIMFNFLTSVEISDGSCSFQKTLQTHSNTSLSTSLKQGQNLSIRMYVKVVIRSESLNVKKKNMKNHPNSQ